MLKRILFTVHAKQFTRFAFTLAETLIVMGIIGVVAALTLPNLNSSTGDKEKVAKVKKIYSNLQDALGRAEAVYGPVSEWFKSSNGEDQIECFAGRITEFMKISKDCKSNITDCFPDKVNGANSHWFYSRSELTRTIILSDGTTILITYESEPGYYARFYVDIDGKNKGPSYTGKDIFYFRLKEDGIVPAGLETGTLQTCPNPPTMACTAWVVTIGNMDYLKLGSNGKCTDGTILDGTTNTTCK